MQTLLLGKRATNAQMRILSAVVAAILIIIGVVDNHTLQILNSLQSEYSIQEPLTPSDISNYNDKGITETPSVVGSDDLYATGIENSVSEEPLRERANFLEETKSELISQREYIIEEENAVAEQQMEIICDPTDITKISNLTEEQIAEWLEGTWLEEEAHTLYSVEQESGLNVFFLYSVATLESEFGTSPRAVDRRNFYGIELQTVWDSFSDCTDYFAGMMYRMYINKETVGPNLEAIGPIYCPPNPKWADTVSDIMKQEYKKITGLTVA